MSDTKMVALGTAERGTCVNKYDGKKCLIWKKVRHIFFINGVETNMKLELVSALTSLFFRNNLVLPSRTGTLAPNFTTSFG